MVCGAEIGVFHFVAGVDFSYALPVDIFGAGRSCRSPIDEGIERDEIQS